MKKRFCNMKIKKFNELLDISRNIYNSKRLKTFNENLKQSISFEKLKWIKQNYNSDRVIEMFDEEVSGGLDW